MKLIVTSYHRCRPVSNKRSPIDTPFDLCYDVFENYREAVGDLTHTQRPLRQPTQRKVSMESSRDTEVISVSLSFMSGER